MGDFNFDSTWTDEQNAIDKDFDDIYLTLNNGKESATMLKKGRFKGWRPDKVLLKKKSNLKPKSIDIIGKYDIPSIKEENGYYHIRTPSDHFGIFTVVEL